MASDLIRQYAALAEFLGRALGPDYEIAVHDLNKKQPSLVALVNGHISGREVGAPLTNIALQIIADRTYLKQPYKLNYRGISASGKVLRCSTFFIKDEKGALVGLLCINFDDSRYKELSQKVFALCHPDHYAEKNIMVEDVKANYESSEKTEQESFYSSIAAATEDALLSVMHTVALPPERLTQGEKMKIVGLLEQKGVFMMKGAVVTVAEMLACSQASIYRYLGKLNREKKQVDTNG